jgi:glycosyltransferase involved in cell wall biosynthesis
MKGKISVNFVIKNGLNQGYSFWESLESCLPFADEIVISEGYSVDGTDKVIAEFAKRNPVKVVVHKDRWDTVCSGHGEVISIISNRNQRRCKNEWIYYLQADEVIHPDNVSFIKRVAKESKYNAVSFPFWHFIGAWKPLEGSAAYKQAIRMVKNRPDITLIGDAWNFGGKIDPVCPATEVPKPVFHLAWVFPANTDEKRLQHGQIYLKMKGYQDNAQKAKENIAKKTVYDKGLPTEGIDLNIFPESVKRLVGAVKYTLPEGVDVKV